MIYSGHVNGDVVAIDTSSWRYDLILHSASSIQDVSITQTGDMLAVATVDGVIYVRTQRESASHHEVMTWHTLAAPVRCQALTSDGLLIVLGTDGTIRIYSIARRQWLWIPVGTADFRRVVVSGDETRAVAVDYAGRLLWVDLAAARRQLAEPSAE
ncbi:MAG TPA: WD40 repeat domain-containing protein [Kofleriaceae bacterium]|jgi:WD40 repeat protein